MTDRSAAFGALPDLVETRADRADRALSGLYARRVKRALDVACVLLGAAAALPVILVAALLARLDGGPAFYGQARVGRGGRIFTCWKIRTMAVDADARLEALLAADPAAAAEWRERQKLSNDPRVTRLGRVLRATSLDELPQLWNVLVGDMSLVGPRPMTPAQRELYPGSAYYALRPGITGYWQVSERNGCAFAGRAAHDARYAREIGFLTDLGVLARTVGVVLRPTGV